MQAVFDSLRQFNITSALVRLLLAMLSGGVVGYGRSKKARAAGFRTYMLISIGAAMAVLLMLFQYEMLKGPWATVCDEVGMKFDASRMASSVTEMLMGTQVPPRKQFIYDNAVDAVIDA